MATEPTPTDALAPCPFCGGGARRAKHSAGVQGTTGYDQWHGVSCATCNACVGASDRRFRTPTEAITAWNRRAQPAPAASPVPLTDERIDALIAAKHFREGYELKASDKVCIRWYRIGLREGEQAHGITKDKP